MKIDLDYLMPTVPTAELLTIPECQAWFKEHNIGCFTKYIGYKNKKKRFQLRISVSQKDQNLALKSDWLSKLKFRVLVTWMKKGMDQGDEL